MTMEVRSESQMRKGKIIVVGGGLAGLMATIKIAEAGHRLNYFHLFQLNVLTLFVPKVELMEQ